MAQFRRRKQTQLTRSRLKEINYKNIPLLQEFIMESGRIVPSRISGASALCQRAVSKQIKLARFLALLPYCDHRK
jgi:small subunit ribosomal protein S18